MLCLRQIGTWQLATSSSLLLSIARAIFHETALHQMADPLTPPAKSATGVVKRAISPETALQRKSLGKWRTLIPLLKFNLLSPLRLLLDMCFVQSNMRSVGLTYATACFLLYLHVL